MIRRTDASVPPQAMQVVILRLPEEEFGKEREGSETESPERELRKDGSKPSPERKREEKGRTKQEEEEEEVEQGGEQEEALLELVVELGSEK